MKNYLTCLAAFLAAFTLSCSGGDDGGDNNTQPPEKATLVFPLNNEECTEGTNATSTHSTIAFQWNPAASANYYQLVIKNLLTGTVEKYTAPDAIYDVQLEKDTPYSWYVVSRRDGTQLSAQSDIWKFYNAGDGVISHPPFPAEIIAPGIGATISTATVALAWNGSDVDNDIVNYELYFDTVSPPSTLLETVSVASVNDVAVSPGTTYYWQVITVDEEGNTSQSEIFQFSVN